MYNCCDNTDFIWCNRLQLLSDGNMAHHITELTKGSPAITFTVASDAPQRFLWWDSKVIRRPATQ